MAEGARLESVCARKGTQGSNPCLSAKGLFFTVLERPKHLRKPNEINDIMSNAVQAVAWKPGFLVLFLVYRIK